MLRLLKDPTTCKTVTDKYPDYFTFEEEEWFSPVSGSDDEVDAHRRVHVQNIRHVGVIFVETPDAPPTPSLSINDLRLSAPQPHAPSLLPPHDLTPAGLHFDTNALGWRAP